MSHAVRLHVVTGKGGVGKSTVAAGLARAAVAAGHEVLAVELGAPAGLSRILGVHPAIPGFPARVGPGLSLSFVEGGAALTEYLGRVLRARQLRERVLSHPLYRAFVAVAPGVGELMAMGKIRDELMQRDGLRHRYGVVVVDAGSSGHALAHLRMHHAAQRTFARGRVRREVDKIDRLLRDPDTTAVHVVALAEHMPLTEANDVLERLRAPPALPVGVVFCNRALEVAPPGFDAALAETAALFEATDERRALRTALAFRRERERLQEEHIARFERATGRRLERVPEVSFEPAVGRDERRLDAIAAVVGRACL